MKQIFSQSEIRYGQTRYKFYLGIDENEDEVKQLKNIKKLIDLHLYYKLDKIINIQFDTTLSEKREDQE